MLTTTTVGAAYTGPGFQPARPLTNPEPAPRQCYLFHIDGLNRQVWSAPARSEKEAIDQVWKTLTEEERNMVVVFDWIDTVDEAKFAEMRAHEAACAQECRSLAKQLADAMNVPYGTLNRVLVDRLLADQKSAGKRWHEALVAIGALS